MPSENPRSLRSAQMPESKTAKSKICSVGDKYYLQFSPYYGLHKREQQHQRGRALAVAAAGGVVANIEEQEEHADSDGDGWWCFCIGGRRVGGESGGGVA